MKKICYLIIILSLFLASCSSEPAKKVLSKDEVQKKMQQSIKNLDNLSIHTDNSTTVIYNKFTTKFSQETFGKSNFFDEFALKAEPKSNNSQFDVNGYKAFIEDNILQLDPKPYYINYRARQADRKYIESTISDIFNLTHITQNVVKPSIEKIKHNEQVIMYEGKDEWMKTLFEYGLQTSAMNQISTLNDLNDIVVTKGKYELTYSPTKIYPKTLTFEVHINAKIKGDPVTIQMRQTTDYFNFNKTKVTPYQE